MLKIAVKNAFKLKRRVCGQSSPTTTYIKKLSHAIFLHLRKILQFLSLFSCDKMKIYAISKTCYGQIICDIMQFSKDDSL